MEVQPDFRYLLELFNKHKVDYLIVGAYALALHGVPRYTGDLDILINPTEKNAGRILKALVEFGFESAGLTERDFVTPDKVIQLGMPPVRINILTSLTGIAWDDAYRDRVKRENSGIWMSLIWDASRLLLTKRH